MADVNFCVVIAGFAEVRADDYLGVGALSTFNLFIGPQVQAGQEIVIPADLDVAHGWTYTGDVARTLVAVARSERSWGRAWHTPQTSDLSVREMVTRFATVAGRTRPAVREMTPLELHTAMADPVMVELAEMQYLFYRENVLDWSRTAAELDLKPTPLDDVLQELAAAA